MTKPWPLPACRAVIVAVVALNLASWLVGVRDLDPIGFPLDDTWIYFDYARSLVDHGRYAFNPDGPIDAATTSYLWTVLLTLGFAVTRSPTLVGLACGAVSLLGLGLAAFELGRVLFRSEKPALLAALLVALSGELTFHALSGMETVFFLVVGLLAIRAAVDRRPTLAGLGLGLVVCVRPDGLALVCVAVAILLRRRAWGELLRVLDVAAPLAGLVFLLNLGFTGRLLGTTMSGRRWLYGLPPSPEWPWNAKLTPVQDYLTQWATRLYGIMLGADWPGPEAVLLPLRLAVVALAFVGLVAGTVRAATFLRGRRPEASSEAWTMLLGWALLHDLTYLLLMPSVGHGGRYQAIHFLMVLVLAVEGVTVLRAALPGFASAVSAGAGTGAVAAIVLLGNGRWRTGYQGAVRHIHDVHLAAGAWIRDHLPPDAVVAAFDIGALRFVGERRIVDIAGLIDPALAAVLYAGPPTDYVRAHGATHLATSELWDSTDERVRAAVSAYRGAPRGRVGTANLFRDEGKKFRVRPLASFEDPLPLLSEDERARVAASWHPFWKDRETKYLAADAQAYSLRHYAYPKIAIYEIEWLDR